MDYKYRDVKFRDYGLAICPSVHLGIKGKDNGRHKIMLLVASKLYK